MTLIRWGYNMMTELDKLLAHYQYHWGNTFKQKYSYHSKIEVDPDSTKVNIRTHGIYLKV